MWNKVNQSLRLYRSLFLSRSFTLYYCARQLKQQLKLEVLIRLLSFFFFFFLNLALTFIVGYRIKCLSL